MKSLIRRFSAQSNITQPANGQNSQYGENLKLLRDAGAQPGDKGGPWEQIITQIMSAMAAGPLIDFRVGGVHECWENIPAQAPTCPRREGSYNYSADQTFPSLIHCDTETMIS